MNIGQRLRSLRKSKGLSLGDVQERTGMHGSHLSRVETGRIVPSLETLQRWAWALDAQLYEFFLEDGQAPPAGVVENKGRSARLLDSRQERLLDLFGRMDSRNQELILSLAESVDKHLPRHSIDAGSKTAEDAPPLGRTEPRSFPKLTRETKPLRQPVLAGSHG